MIEKTKGQYVLLEPDELPNISSIKDAIIRLRKDAELLKKLSRAKDVNPDNLKKTADFLEHLITAYKKQFPVGEKNDDVIETSDNSGSGRDAGSEPESATKFVYEPRYGGNGLGRMD